MALEWDAGSNGADADGAADRGRGDGHVREIPVIVLTARDLSAGERQRLNGSVARILQKGAYGQEALLAEVRRLVGASVKQRWSARAE